MRETFYHSTTKKIIVAFGTIFDEVRFKDGFDREILVPLHYSPRAKWLESLQSNPDIDKLNIDTILPRMGFELTGLNFSPERHTNPLNRFDDVDGDENTNQFMYNRVPYDFMFDLNIATVRYEDLLKILEQIIPFFTPELTVTINDMEIFNNPTNIPVILNSVSIQTDYEGSMDQRRTVMSVLQFTVKGFLYSNIRTANRIKKTIMNLHNDDFDSVFTRFTSEVVPFEADKGDVHSIVDTSETIVNG